MEMICKARRWRSKARLWNGNDWNRKEWSEQRLTQSQKVLRHLSEIGEITPMDAMKQYGIMRLGARIWDLKRQGYQIETEIGTGKNRYGETTHWAIYKLRSEQDA